MIEKRKNAFSGTEKSTKTLCVVLAAVLFTTVGCDKLRSKTDVIIEIANSFVPFTVYSLNRDIGEGSWFEEGMLAGSSCQWTNLQSPGMNGSSLIIINSEDELENYIACTDSIYPKIDFSTHTLLLAHGSTTSLIHSIDVILTKTAQNSCAFYINIGLTSATAPARWVVAVIISKISQNTIVVLNVNHRQL